MEKMTREFLEEKGITDKEVINAILDKHHEIVKDLKSDSEKITTLQTENDSLKKQIEERDKDLKELKKIDATEMQNKIDELENKNKTQKEEYDKQLLETKKGLLIENSLISSKAKNLKAIKGLLDMDKITLEDGNIKGLDEQIKSLQESDSYLFNLEKQTKTVDLSGEHKEPTKKEPSSLIEALHEKYDN